MVALSKSAFPTLSGIGFSQSKKFTWKSDFLSFGLLKFREIKNNNLTNS